mmetsp:Transcript_25301/g.45113  ORF Transcript_25301/g.45113 Transcript_25301/m.45113 type:complete len:217 (-) Transcript_25301:81-731(-)
MQRVWNRRDDSLCCSGRPSWMLRMSKMKTWRLEVASTTRCPTASMLYTLPLSGTVATQLCAGSTRGSQTFIVWSQLPVRRSPASGSLSTDLIGCSCDPITYSVCELKSNRFNLPSKPTENAAESPSKHASSTGAACTWRPHSVFRFTSYSRVVESQEHTSSRSLSPEKVRAETPSAGGFSSTSPGLFSVAIAAPPESFRSRTTVARLFRYSRAVYK